MLTIRCATILLCTLLAGHQGLAAVEAQEVLAMLATRRAEEVEKALALIPKVPAASRPQILPAVIAIVGDPLQGIEPRHGGPDRAAWKAMPYLGAEGLERTKQKAMAPIERTRTGGNVERDAMVEVAAEALVAAGPVAEQAVADILTNGSPEAVARITMFLNVRQTGRPTSTPATKAFDAQLAALAQAPDDQVYTIVVAIGQLAATNPDHYARLVQVIPGHDRQNDLIDALRDASAVLWGQRLGSKPGTNRFATQDAAALMNRMLVEGQITGYRRAAAGQVIATAGTPEQLTTWIEANRGELLGPDAQFRWTVLQMAGQRVSLERLRVALPVAEAQAVLQGAPNTIPPDHAGDVQAAATKMLVYAREAGQMGGASMVRPAPPAKPASRTPAAGPALALPAELPADAPAITWSDYQKRAALANQAAQKTQSTVATIVKKVDTERAALLKAEEPVAIPALMQAWRNSGSWLKRMRPAGEMGGQKLVQEETNPTGVRLVARVKAYVTDQEDLAEAATTAKTTIEACESQAIDLTLLALRGSTYTEPQAGKIVEQLLRNQQALVTARDTLWAPAHEQADFLEARAAFIDPIKAEINAVAGQR